MSNPTPASPSVGDNARALLVEARSLEREADDMPLELIAPKRALNVLKQFSLRS